MTNLHTILDRGWESIFWRSLNRILFASLMKRQADSIELVFTCSCRETLFPSASQIVVTLLRKHVLQVQDAMYRGHFKMHHHWRMLCDSDYPNRCFCGKAPSSSLKIDSGECNLPCVGDTSDNCGGRDAISIETLDGGSGESGECYKDAKSARILNSSPAFKNFTGMTSQVKRPQMTPVKFWSICLESFSGSVLSDGIRFQPVARESRSRNSLWMQLTSHQPVWARATGCT